jgi:hypothetical protein
MVLPSCPSCPPLFLQLGSLLFLMIFRYYSAGGEKYKFMPRRHKNKKKHK